MTTIDVESPAARAEISRWAREHGVTWEVHPFTRCDDGVVHRVGHELQLTCRAPDLAPGCPECRRVYQRVHELADVAIAAAHAQRVARVRNFEAALRFRPTTGEPQPEIEVAVEIAAPEGDPRGEAEEARCREEFERTLKQLGVRHH